jgi:BASS family bile acid:Na+ symporter
MVLLMVVTVLYMPVVLPLLVEGAEVTPWDIAGSLIFLMLVPLALGLLVKSRSPGSAARWQPVMNRISGLAVIVLVVVGSWRNLSNIRGLIGTGGILALLLFILGSFVIGFLLGGRDPADRRVMALGAAQRNVATALVVASQNFPRGNTLSFVLVGAILLLLILLPAALGLGATRVPAA